MSPAIGPNPYKGLSAFLEEDAESFFGREKLIQELWEKFRSLHELSLSPPPPVDNVVNLKSSVRGELVEPPADEPFDKLRANGDALTSTALGVRGGGSPLRLLAILGPSGSGKSSVVRAGLIPELARRPLPGMRQARLTVFTPGAHPIEALATILARIATNDPVPVAKAREFAEEMRRQSPLEGGAYSPPGRGQGWVSYEGLRRITDALPDINVLPLIILIDQFEEIYSLCENTEERQQFINNLLHVAADPSKYVSVIIALRSDFLGQTQRHPDFNHAIAANEVIVPVMNDRELHDAIAKPAERAGHLLDEATIRLLIEQTEGREGALPLLQFALTRIWENLPVEPAETLKKIGGVGGALADKAQRLFNERLSQTDRTIARRAFLAMIRLGEGTQDTRQRIPISDIVAYGEDSPHVHEVLQVFSQPGARLITLSADPNGSETAEVTHEALFEHWETLKDWLESSRDDLRFHRRLAEAAKHWDEQGYPDGLLWRPPDLDLLRQYHYRAGDDMTFLQMEFFEASKRKERYSRWGRRIAVTALVVLTVIAMGAAGVAFWAYNQVKTQKIAAVYQSQISLIRLLVAYSYKEDTQASRERMAFKEPSRIKPSVFQTFVSDVQSMIRTKLMSYLLIVPKEDVQANRERAALLARLASTLNNHFTGGMDAEIEILLRTIFRTSAIVEGPGHDATRKELLDLSAKASDSRRL